MFQSNGRRKKNNFVREEKMKWEIERRWQWWVGVRRWVIWTKSGLNHKGERGSFERKEKKKKNKQKGSPADSVLRSCVILAFVPDARAQDDFFFSSSYHLLGSRGGDLYRARFRHNFPLFIFIFFSVYPPYAVGSGGYFYYHFTFCWYFHIFISSSFSEKRIETSTRTLWDFNMQKRCAYYTRLLSSTKPQTYWWQNNSVGNRARHWVRNNCMRL